MTRTVSQAVADALDEAHGLMKRINAGIWTRDYRDLANVVQRAYHASLDSDGCEFCHGLKGGVPGNANVIEGHVVCDFCHALLADIEKAKKNPSPRRAAGIVEDV